MSRCFLAGVCYRVIALLIFCSLAAVGRSAETDVIINEIMYHPPLDLVQLQYIELFNRGDSPVNLSKWSLAKGLKFEFPDKTQLSAGGYLVICRDVKAFTSNYGADIPVLGDFSGHLSHRGEKIELCNAAGTIIDEVKYEDHEPWPTAPDGHSPSLERICPFVSGKLAENWGGSVLRATEKPGGTPGRVNDNFSAKPLPAIGAAVFKPGLPDQKTLITVEVTDAGHIKTVTLLWRIARTGSQTPERELPMVRTAGDDTKGTYQASIDGQPSGTLVRFRIKATNADGAERLKPSPTEPRPTYSYASMANTNSARIAFAYVINVGRPQRQTRVEVWNERPYQIPASPTRGNGAFIYAPPDGGEVQTFDYVSIRPRKGGFKVKFKKEQAFKGMTGINVLFEGPPRWVLAEPMAYELYRLAGVPACLAEHVRVWIDGRLIGYQLLLEQPNKSFLARNKRDDTGSLYKVNWMGQGLRGQHVKKTHLASSPDDLVTLYNGLTKSSGADQWSFIQKNFNVDEFINYYAVNMCIENWDGFFNNYYLYHDSAKEDKWEMYPWDEDKTFGEYDGCSREYDWYEMPLSFGSGDRQGGFSFRGFGGGWMRPPGWFSGPLLSNKDFRKAFLTRLNEICTTIFTEPKFVPLIDAMEKRLSPEIPIRAELTGLGRQEALREFHHDIQSLRNQVKNRREFIIQQIPKDRASR
jgi:hypothetical protein